ncbi:MAG: glycoside hydrolase family 25 protein [Acetatifactor sp.]|nr:glycoside hydrolase family 25 protein [Acetatifactor sp.]
MRGNFEDKEKKQMNSMLFSTAFAVSLFVITIVLMVVLINTVGKQNEKKRAAEREALKAEESLESIDEEEEITVGTLTPDDFDFWDKYPEEPLTEEDIRKPSDTASGEGNSENDDPSTDGKHTKVINRDGTEEWVLISQYLAKNEYDYTNLVSQDGLMKYFVDGKQVSYVGIDVSKYQDYIDFVKVKKAGIDFVMIRVGARAYSTGQLILDEYFADNLKRASDAGLMVGLYFYSQAISEEEAVEEAQMVINSIGDAKISYPIAIDMEFVPTDTARIEALSKADKTKVIKTFLDNIAAAGYKGAVYGDKEWLIKEIDMSKLSDYDVWLAQYEDIPDYPYKFSMWQYDTKASVDGISGYTDLNISFIDYSEK